MHCTFPASLAPTARTRLRHQADVPVALADECRPDGGAGAPALLAGA